MKIETVDKFVHPFIRTLTVMLHFKVKVTLFVSALKLIQSLIGDALFQGAYGAQADCVGDLSCSVLH